MTRWIQITHPVVAVPILILASFLVYANTLPNGFVYDDGWAVADNQNLREWSTLPTQVASPRSIKSVTLMIDYHLWGLDPMGYHLTNILLHGLCTLAFYSLASIVSQSQRVALLAGLFFALHPIHTEAVANINNRKDTLAALFLILALILYIRKGRSLLGYGGVGILYLLSLFSKEVAGVAFLPLALLYDLYYRSEKGAQGLKTVLLRLFPFITITLGAGLYLLRVAPASMKPPDLLKIDYSEHLGTVARAFLKYVQLLLFPFNLNADHVVPSPDSILDLRAIAGIGLLSLVIYAAVKAYSHSRLLSFGIWWMILAWFPISKIIPIVHYDVAERYLYLPSAGFCLVLAVLMERAFVAGSVQGFQWIRRAAPLMAGIVVVSYALSTYHRNFDWRSDFTLWSKTVIQSPNSYNAHFGLANAYLKGGSLELAVHHYQETIRIHPRMSDAYVNLGITYQRLGKRDEAAQALRTGLKINPQDSMARTHLGELYWDQGLKTKALSEFQAVIRAHPQSIPGYLKLGSLLQQENQFAEALFVYQKALSLDAHHPKVHSHLGDLYTRLGRLDLALGEFHRALELEPTAYSYHDVGVSYLRVKRPDLAIEHFQKAVDLDPEFPEGIYRLAQTEEEMGAFERALSHYERFIRLAGDRYPSLVADTRARILKLRDQVRVGYD